MMTVAALLLDNKEAALKEEAKEKVLQTRRRRRRYCVMNTAALLSTVLLLALLVLRLLFRIYFCPDAPAWRSFGIQGDSFVKDGRPFKYISGSMHYSRVPAVYWRDRLRKMRQAGLDAVQTYVPWNFHQPRASARPDWSGDRNLTAFLRTAQEEGLLVILRAGPYICAEWDFGGLPAWLLQKNASMVIRSSDPQFLRYTDAWLKELLGKVRPLLYANGGPVIMVQLENEYGSYYTCDRRYMAHLYDLGRQLLGERALLFTTDGNAVGYLRCGNIDRRFFPTVDFGTGAAKDPEAAFAGLRKWRRAGPLVNSEFYVGWLDVWGGGHAHVAVQPIVEGLSAMYKYAASVNMYMFFGGTNFAFWNGAEDAPLKPQVTSYDYDAPLSEAGHMTWKYQRLRAAIHALKGRPLANLTVANASVTAYGRVPMKPLCHFLSLLSPSPAGRLASMESHGVLHGFAVYSASVALGAGRHRLNLTGVRDRASVFTADSGGRSALYHGVVLRDGAPSLTLSLPRAAARLHVLVENAGHVNFNRHMFGDVKGLAGPVTLDGRRVDAWRFSALDVTRPSRLHGCDLAGKPSQGMFYGGQFDVGKSPNDTYLLASSFNKGQAMINKDGGGTFMNLGRYWPSAGPQKSLYVPKTFLRPGTNSLLLFEVEGVRDPGRCRADFVSTPVLGRRRGVAASGRNRV